MPSPTTKPIRLLFALAAAGWFAAGVLGGWVPRLWIHYYEALQTPGFENPELAVGIRVRGVFSSLAIGSVLEGGLALVVIGCVTLAVLGRGRRAWRAFLWAFTVSYLLLLVHAGALFDLAYTMELGVERVIAEETGDRQGPDQTALLLNLMISWPAPVYLGLAVLLAGLQVLATTAPGYRSYGFRPSPEEPAPGDRVVEALRSFGVDDLWAKSAYASTIGHLALIFGPLVVASLLATHCVRPVDAPAGSGTPTTPPTTAQKVVKEKKYKLQIDSPYIIDVPDPDISQVMKNIDQQSENIYEASATGTPGALGKGGGDTGGFGGPPGGELRFIRISYRCPGWDDGLTPQTHNADRNFLSWYANLPSVSFEVADKGEAYPIDALADFPRGREPQFVFMTGEGRGNISSSQTRILKRYLEHGGLLFVDAGSRSFDRWFRGWVKNLTGGHALKRIPKDDPIFRIPYNFPEGIDPTYQHGPPYAMGYMLRDRWSIFYHPGDMNDCWKDNAHKINKSIRVNAKQIAYNVIYYAIIHYMDDNEKYLKK